MKRLTDSQIRGLPTGGKRSEIVEPSGSLLAWHRPNGTKEFYYRRRKKGEKEVSIKLGTFPTLSLANARKKAQELAEKSTEVIDLKFHLEEDKRQKEAAEEAVKLARARADSLGTLDDLCKVYVGKMKSEGRSSAVKVDEALKRYVIDPHPHLAKMSANLITTDHVADILSAMIEKGITTHVNRTRGDLHAAFNVGLVYDFSPTLRTQKKLCFDISVNPVSRIPTVKKWERALSRNLTAEELHTVWHATPQHMSPTYSALFRILVCTGFHPSELLRLKVKDVNLKEQCIYMIQTKTGTPNLIPLNRFAIAELKPFVELHDPELDLFPSRVRNPRSDVHKRASVLANQVAKLRKELDGVEKFTARDIRRTVKTLMGKAGISKEIRDRLQNHAVQDVSGKHYDRYDYWEEKRAAMQKWENWLTKYVVESEKGNKASNVVALIKN